MSPRRNPLKSGQAFKAGDAISSPIEAIGKSQSPQIGSSVQRGSRRWSSGRLSGCRNPLKSGQAFKGNIPPDGVERYESVAIPSNRVKRSKVVEQVTGEAPTYTKSQSPQIGSSVQSRRSTPRNLRYRRSRNPLKSGQAFKGWRAANREKERERRSQSPQIGSSVQRMQGSSVFKLPPPVAIPSNRVKRSKVHQREEIQLCIRSRNPLKSGQAFKGYMPQ